MPRQGEEPVPGYRLQRRLGRGSFGEVWQAGGPGGTLAALKFIALGDQHAIREFRSIQRIKQIRHVHLMPLIGIWLVDQNEQLLDEAFLAEWGKAAPPPQDSRHTLKLPSPHDRRPVELIEAMPLGDQDLYGRLQDCLAAGQQGIPVSELLGYLQDAAKAIDFLNAPRHDLGEGPVAIHHGDIKPQNIMLIGGSAQVCDFGLARILGGLHATSTALAGSPAYMAPESIRDKRPHRTTDQYSLAITYAELRTGALPFDSQSYLDVLNSHLDGKLQLDKLPPDERVVIEKGTALDPEQRFDSCLAMVRALQQAAGVSVAMLPTSANRDTPRSAGSAPTAAANAIPSGTMMPDRQFLATGPIADSAPSPLSATPRTKGAGDTAKTLPIQAEIVQSEVLAPRRRGRPLLALLMFALVGGSIAGGVWWLRKQQQQLAANAAVSSVAATADGSSNSTRVAGDAAQTTPAGSSGAAPVAEIATTSTTNTDAAPVEPAGADSSASSPSESANNASTSSEVSPVEPMPTDPAAADPVTPEPPPENQPPTVELAEELPTVYAGDTLKLGLSGSDPEGEALTYQWRTGKSQTWQTAPEGVVEIANLPRGELHLEVRTVDPLGLPSESLSYDLPIELAAELTNSLDMQLRLIPAGEFQMGSAETTAELQEAFQFSAADRAEPFTHFDDELPQHAVRITKPFYLGAHEVTQADFARFVADTGYQTDAERDGQGGGGWDEANAQLGRAPRYTWKSWGIEQPDRAPVANVSWNDAVKFCAWLSAKEGKKYRLPTEAEWEYACRAGTTTRFSSGDDPASVVSVGNVLDEAAHEKLPDFRYSLAASDGWAFAAPVGSLQANDLGLFDLHGNVWEWCGDWYSGTYYAESPAADPPGPATGTARILRGGGWGPYPAFNRSSYRGWEAPDYRECYVGFRVVREL